MTSPNTPYTDSFTASLPTWIPSAFSIFQGVPFPIWGAIIWQESNFNPDAHNTGNPPGKEDSVGLLQLNRHVPAWGKYSVAELKNPVTNLMLGSADIRAAYAKYGDNIAQVVVNSGHPGKISPNDPAVQPYVAKYNALKNIDPAAAIVEILKGTLQGVVGPGGWIDPGAIGEGFVGGLASFWQGLWSGTHEELVGRWAGPGMALAGVGLVIVGAIVAAAKSDTGQQVIQGASQAAGVAAVA